MPRLFVVAKGYIWTICEINFAKIPQQLLIF